jgi:uroporphyrinogen decarboxylase
MNPALPPDCRGLPLAERTAVIARFEGRLQQALESAPPGKTWVREAVARRGAGRCPVRIKRLSFDLILRYHDALADLFCQYPDDVVVAAPYEFSIGHQPPGKPRIDPVQVLTEDAQWTDEWGTRWGHSAGGVGPTPVAGPLTDWSQLNGYLATGVPDPAAPGRFDAAARTLAVHSPRHYCYGVANLALFERLHALRGMAEAFADLHEHPAEVRRLLDRLAEYLLVFLRGWAALGADAVFITDDWGSQTGLMISPAMWRQVFKPYYAAIFAEVHRLGMDVIFHSCGNVMAIVADLIEAGVDVLDPIQPGPMDLARLAREFGGRVSFAGGIDLQRLLSRGTPREIRETVGWLIGTLGAPFGGGLILGPANVMGPEIPLDNLRALFEAAHSQSC